MFLVRFQNGCKKYLASNQLTTMTVEKTLVEEEPEFPTIPVMPDEIIPLYKVYYDGVHVVLYFSK